MKKTIIILGIIFFLTGFIEAKKLYVGFSLMVGGRYDNLRMCVASSAGAKGGLIADMKFYFKYEVTEKFALGINIPVFRPILFGAAHRMLQFEPDITFEFKIKTGERGYVVVGPAIGFSLHYGPDYKSSKTNRGPSFFAAGPEISLLAGYGFSSKSGKSNYIIGVRTFYIPFFAKDRTGTTIGSALESYFFF